MNAQPQPSQALTLEEARGLVEHHASGLCPASMEIANLLGGAGRVLAEDIAADRDLPPFPRVTRDGYAVRSADVASVPAKLKVIGEIRAGGALEAGVSLNSGEAAAIMTGAPAPPGADAVVMVEYTEVDGNRVQIKKSVAAGENIVPAGAEARRGELLLARGTRLDYAAISLAASVGRARVKVYRRPRVAILSTGDEVVDIAAEPGANQIRNSNSYSLGAQVQAVGAEAVLLPIAPDEPVQLKHLIEEGLSADLLLLTGGVSMGKYDLVEQVLSGFRAEFFFTGALIQPGRPVVFGRAAMRPSAQPTYFLGLPGNPVSTMVTFELFARPIVEGLCGARPTKLQFVFARLKFEVKTHTGLTRFLPAVLSGAYDTTEVELVRWQGSGDVAAIARANCWLVVPPDRDRIPAGELAAVMLRG